MELYFIRHAQSRNNVRFDETGQHMDREEDPEITELGHQQAKIMARHLARPLTDYEGHILDYQNRHGFGLTHLYCSLMVRAVETGMYVARACDLPLVAWPEIHERGGIFLPDRATGERRGLPGNNRAFFTMRFPYFVLPDDLSEEGWWNQPAELWEAVEARARLVLQQLLERHSGTEDRVAIVSHGGFFQVLTAVLLNIPPQISHNDIDRTSRFALNNVSISRFVFTEQTIDVVYLNNTRFLPPELLT